MILGASSLGSRNAQLGATGATALPQTLVGRLIRLVGSYIPQLPLVGRYVAMIDLTGMYTPSITVTGKVGEDGN